MRKVAIFTLVTILSITVFAHEFWLQPLKFWLNIGEGTEVSILVGENYKGDKSDASKYNIQQLKHYSIHGVEDYTAHLSQKDKSVIEASFTSAGNHLLSFNNSNKFIELEPGKFNEYLREEGLDYIYRKRKQSGDDKKPGREFYQRCVKTLFKVNNSNDSTFAIHTGLRWEIIPHQNPYLAKEGDKITWKLLFDNQPVEGALVLAWNVTKGKTSKTKYHSNAAGEVTIPVTLQGRWMISSVHMIPQIDTKEADWQSFWGSYTFGYY